MVDESDLRSRFPEIAWDQPIEVTITGHGTFWVCRYCVALHGLRAQDVIEGVVPEMVYDDSVFAKLHIDAIHHD
jgi:hypothetical protein